MRDDDASLAPSGNGQPGPVFQAFTVKSTPGRGHRKVADAAVGLLGAGWTVQNYGGSNTQFEVFAEEGRLTQNEAWNLTYRLRMQPGISHAEPVFKAWITDRPDWGITADADADVGGGETQVGALSGISNTFCGRGPDLPEAQNREWSLSMARVLRAWANHFPNQVDPGRGVVIGHPDTGYRRHPEMGQNILVGRGFDLFRGDDDPRDELDRRFSWQTPGHGTHTASVIVSPRGPASGTSPNFVSGVAPGAKLVPFRVSDTVVIVDALNLARAIEMAADAGVDVISISMGGLGSDRLHDAVLYAVNKGVIVLAAAGNCVGFVVAPASYEEVVAVAACNAQAGIWGGSSRGAAVDVTAPGDRVWIALADDDDTLSNVDQSSGTSYAVATVAGVAALWVAKHGRKKIAEVCGGVEKIAPAFMQLIRSTAVPQANWPVGQFGGGLVDADKLLAAPLPDGAVAPGPPATAEEHALVDRGGPATFAHLFEVALTARGDMSRPVAARLAEPQEELSRRLADLLNTSVSELPGELRQVGQELAFHLATHPGLHRGLADASVHAAISVASGRAPARAASEATHKVDSVRQCLLDMGVSRPLGAKLLKRSGSMRR
jgi:serine protease